MLARDMCLWFLGQLYRGHRLPGDYINLRVIHNKKPYHDEHSGKLMEPTESLLNQNIDVNKFGSQFVQPGGWYDKLDVLNKDPAKPGNIYFGINLRKNAKGNKKSDVRGFFSFYLDLDVTDQFSLADRWAQIQFWIDIGFEPTFAINSGHGIQVYWVLNVPVTQEEGEALLKNMVLITGCKGGGNTFDITRIFRLPGFLNQKGWYKSDSPPCTVAYPSVEWIEANKTELRPRYAAVHFKYFPPSLPANIKAYIAEAQLLDGDFNENLKALVKAKADHIKNQQVSDAATKIGHDEGSKGANTAPTAGEFVPTLKVVPPDYTQIKWPSGMKTWIKNVCKHGLHGLTPEQEDAIKKKFGLEEINNSDIDAKIMFYLISMGYTKEAVIDFWKRPTIKLWRADKMASSPDYLNITYDNMLEAVKSMKSSKTPDAMVKQANMDKKIFFVNHETWGITNGKAKRYMNFEMEVKALYRNMDAEDEKEREYFDLLIHYVDGKGKLHHEQKLIPRHDIRKPDALNNHCTGKMMVLTNGVEDMNQVVEYLLSMGPSFPVYEIHPKMCYKDKSFVFPRLVITKEEIRTTKTFTLIRELRKKFPWYNDFIDYVPKREDVVDTLRTHWANLIRVHTPQLVCGVLGSIAVTAIRAILEEEDINKRMHIPVVNVRGRSHSGKTESIEMLYRLTGSMHNSTCIGMSSSTFGMERILTLVNICPLVVDEFKEENDPKSIREVANLRSLARRVYSGQVVVKGRADLSVGAEDCHGSLIISGEAALDRDGNVSEITRGFPAITEAYMTGDNKCLERFVSMRDAKFHEIGPYFYQWLLSLDHKKAFNDFAIFREKVINALPKLFSNERPRIGSNLAILQWGCSLWDGFIKSMDPTLPTLSETFTLHDVFVKYLAEVARENDSSMTYINKETGEEEAVAQDEALNFIATLSRMITTRTQDITRADEQDVFLFRADEKNNELCIPMSHAYDFIRQHMLRQHLQPPTYKLIKSRLSGAFKRNEPWILKPTNIYYRGANAYCHRFVLSTMCEMGVWHKEITDSKTAPPSDNGKKSDFPNKKGGKVLKMPNNTRFNTQSGEKFEF